MKITSKYFEYGNSRLGALLPIALFLIVSIASLTPFLIHNSEQSAERGIYNGEWAKIQWGLNGLRHSHAHKIDLGDNPTGATTVATISYGDFHVTASIMERKTLMGRNECFSMTPMIFRGAGTNADPYRDAGYNLEEITLTYDSMPGVAAGGNSSFAWRKDGYLYAWGSNGTKQLGVGDDTLNRTSPVLVEQGSLPTPKPTNYNNGWLVATGLSSSLIVDYAGNLYETGKVNNTSNYSKSPLLNTNPNLKQGVLDIAVGDNFMVVVPDDNEGRPFMKSWQEKVDGGVDEYKTLTNESEKWWMPKSSNPPKEGVSGVIGLAAGNKHYIAMTKEGYLWGIGDNTSYQLGSSIATQTYVWINDDAEEVLVKEIPELNAKKIRKNRPATEFTITEEYIVTKFELLHDSKPTKYIDLESKIELKHTDGTIYVLDIGDENNKDYVKKASDKFLWKYEHTHGTPIQLKKGTYKIEIYKATWFIVPFYTGEQGNNWYYNHNLKPEQGIFSLYGKPLEATNFIGVAAGENFSMSIQREDGVDTLYSWGTNDKGQLGLGNTETKPFMIAVPDFPPSGRTIKNIVAGNKHAMALLDNGDLYVWGDNSSGQLGITNPSPGQNYVTIPTKISNIDFGGKKIVSIAAGYNHSLAMDEDLTVYSWGSNSDGQLGRIGTASLPGEVTSFPVPSS